MYTLYTTLYTCTCERSSQLHANTPEVLKKEPVEGASRSSTLACGALMPLVARSNRASKNSLLPSLGAPGGVRWSLTAVSLSENAVFPISLSKLTSRVNLTRFRLLALFAIFLSFFAFFFALCDLKPAKSIFCVVWESFMSGRVLKKQVKLCIWWNCSHFLAFVIRACISCPGHALLYSASSFKTEKLATQNSCIYRWQRYTFTVITKMIHVHGVTHHGAIFSFLAAHTPK